MKLLIATGIYPPDIGGPATYSKLIFDKLTGRGHEVSVVTYGDEKAEKDKIIFVSRRIPKGLRHMVYFFKIFVKGRRSDIIFAQDPVSAGLPALVAAKVLGKKFFLKIVGDYAWEQGMQRFGVNELLDGFLDKKYGFAVEFLRSLERWVAGKAKRIIVPSEYLKGVVMKWGVSEERISVVQNSVSLLRTGSSADERRKLNLSGVVILSAGRFVPWKGFDMLVSIMPEIRKKYDAKLIILGDGPDRGRLEGLRDSLNLADSVFFPGPVQRSVLFSYLASCDVFALNTGYEGFSHQVLEAMLFGAPVVTTTSGGNKEIIKNKENAIAVPYNEKNQWIASIEELLDNKNLRDKLSSRGHSMRDIYTEEAMIDKTISVIEAP